VRRSYRRDFWQVQPGSVIVASEKGTVRAACSSRLDEYGVGFRVMHGFGSATAAHEIAEDNDGRDLTILYAITIRAACICPRKTCPSASRNMAATMCSPRGSAIRYDLDGLPTFAAPDKKPALQMVRA
jgi:hypothetical protein